MTDVPWVSVDDDQSGTSPAGAIESAEGAAFAAKRTEALMPAEYHQQHRSNFVGELFRSLVQMAARLLMGESFILVPQWQLERLRQLERRERLRMAERLGDDEFLDREITKVQLTAADLARTSVRTTPISQWPDEGFEGCLESQEQHGKGTRSSAAH